MRTVKPVTILLAFLVPAVLCECLAAGSETTERAPDSRHAGFIVKVAADATVVPLDFDTLESLLRSDAVAGQAARAVLNMKYDDVSKSIDVQPVSTSHGDPQDGESHAPAGPGVVQAAAPSAAQTVFLSLVIDLPRETKPAARAFATALVENLRHTLEAAFQARTEELRNGLKQARAEQDTARVALSEMVGEIMPPGPVEIRLDPVAEAVRKQLDTLVDLSMLNPLGPFGEAVNLIRRSVQPPLQIVVLWRELFDNAQIEPTTPINMDGLTNVRLGAALKNLLDTMSNPQLDVNLDYVVSNGVITIGTRESLPHKMETQVHEIPILLQATGQTDGLTALIQRTIEPESWLDLSERGQGTISSWGDAKLTVWQTPEVHKAIAELLRTKAAETPIATPADTPRETLEQQMQFLLGYRDRLEEEIGKLQERQAAMTREKNDSRKRAMESALRTTSSELYRALSDLGTVRSRISASSKDSPEIHAIDRVIERISQCADSCNQGLGPQRGYSGSYTGMGWPSWIPFREPEMNEAQTISKRLAAKMGEQESVSHRIAMVHNALTGQAAFDPQVHRLQLAAKRLEKADLRVQQLEQQIAALQPCTVALLEPER